MSSENTEIDTNLDFGLDTVLDISSKSAMIISKVTFAFL
jgi:hypothetical protein